MLRCEEISDVVTTRWIDYAAGGQLVQETAYQGVRFTRRFERIEDAELL